MRRIRLLIIVGVSVLSSVVLFVVLTAVLRAVSAQWHTLPPTDVPTLERRTFSLAPPQFLLRLSLFPSATRKRSLVWVIIENHENARPYHQGLEKALFVEEFFVEGMITRFLAMFDTADLPPFIGPVRSLRPYFVD